MSKPNSWLLAKNKYNEDKLPGSVEGIWVRKSILKMLGAAVKSLPRNLKLLVWDGWRPVSVQAWLYQKSKEAVKIENEGLGPTYLSREASKYAANPNDAENKIPPHATGGAIDVCLLDSSNKMLETGTPLDYFGDKAMTAYFENEKKKRVLNPDELVALQNRRILFWTMVRSGFTNYPYEWWHFDFGNQLWAIATGKEAIYGAVDLSNI